MDKSSIKFEKEQISGTKNLVVRKNAITLQSSAPPPPFEDPFEDEDKKEFVRKTTKTKELRAERRHTDLSLENLMKALDSTFQHHVHHSPGGSIHSAVDSVRRADSTISLGNPLQSNSNLNLNSNLNFSSNSNLNSNSNVRTSNRAQNASTQTNQLLNCSQSQSLTLIPDPGSPSPSVTPAKQSNDLSILSPSALRCRRKSRSVSEVPFLHQVSIAESNNESVTESVAEDFTDDFAKSVGEGVVFEFPEQYEDDENLPLNFCNNCNNNSCHYHGRSKHSVDENLLKNSSVDAKFSDFATGMTLKNEIDVKNLSLAESVSFRHV